MPVNGKEVEPQRPACSGCERGGWTDLDCPIKSLTHGGITYSQIACGEDHCAKYLCTSNQA